jgi:hypothetical protein
LMISAPTNIANTKIVNVPMSKFTDSSD